MQNQSNERFDRLGLHSYACYGWVTFGKENDSKHHLKIKQNFFLFFALLYNSFQSHLRRKTNSRYFAVQRNEANILVVVIK